MTVRPGKRTGISFMVVALAAILVSGGTLAACSKSQTTTSAPASTTTSSTTTRTSTSALPTTTTSAPTTTTTSAPAPTGVSSAEFYKANVVTVVVPYAPGGGVDYAARLIASYWTQVTGGRMVVVNKEGASGITGGNYAFAAKSDGLTIGASIIGAGLITPTLSQDAAVKFDIKKMNWILEYDSGDNTGVGITAKLPYTSMEELSKVSGLKFASSGGLGTQGAGLVIDWFGLKDARIVLGYAGTSEAFLAVGKGEVDAYVTANSNQLDAMTKGFVKKPLLTLVARDNYFPDVPSIPELLKLSPEQQNILKTFGALAGGNPFWFQPGVPQDRIDFARDAFTRIVALEDFKKQAATRWKFFNPVSGKDFAAEMEKTLAAVTPDNFKQLQAIGDKYVRR